MSILVLVLLLAVLYLILLVWDLRTLRNPETNEYKPRWMSDTLVLVAPYLLLFYQDSFWSSLFYYFLPLFIGFVLLGKWAKRWRKPEAEITHVNGVGSLLLTLLLYFLFFQGSMAEEVASQNPIEKTGGVWWPFFTMLVLGVVTAVINSEKILLLVGLLFLVLPFFALHPLWTMLAATVIFLMTCFAVAQRQSNGAYVAVFFFYAIAQILALLVYVIFF